MVNSYNSYVTRHTLSWHPQLLYIAWAWHLLKMLVAAWILVIANIKQPITEPPWRGHANLSDVKRTRILHLHNGRGHPQKTQSVMSILVISNIKQPIIEPPWRGHAYLSDVKRIRILHFHNGRGHPQKTQSVMSTREVKPEGVKLYTVALCLRRIISGDAGRASYPMVSRQCKFFSSRSSTER